MTYPEYRPKQMSIREASLAYGVSRMKVTRLIQKGAVRADIDPRDDRVTLVNVSDLDAIFQQAGVDAASSRPGGGSMTSEIVAKMDEIRTRIEREAGVVADSTDTIREEREKRTLDLLVASGDLREDATVADL